MTCVNVSNFAFHILVGRQLGPSSYGAVSALLNIVTVISVPLSAFQAAVVVDVAKRGGSHALALRRLFDLTLLVGFGVTAALMAASPLIADFLGLGSVLPVLVLSIWFVPTIPTPALAGASIGQFRFKPVAVASVAGALVRLLLTGLLGLFGLGLEGPLIGTAAGSVITLLALAFALRPNLRRYGRRPLRLSGSTMRWTLTALGGYSALLGVDTVLARHLFGTIEAGRYAAAATAAHTALFVAAAIATLVFPRFLAELDQRVAKRELLHSSLLVGMAGFGVAVILSIAPHLVVAALFGGRYQGIAPELRLLGTESALLGVLNVIIYFLIARRSFAAFIPWLAVVGVTCESLFLHVGPEQLAWSMLGLVTLSTVSMGIAAAAWRPSPASRPSAVSTLDLPPDWYDSSAVHSVDELDLSLIVPYYNPGSRLKPHVAEILTVLRASGLTFEVITVSDGSMDGSDTGLEDLGAELRIVRLQSKTGKGNALKTGFSLGRGRYLGFIDGDGDIPARTLEPFIKVVREDQPDMAIASKWHPDSEVVCPPVRRIYSWVFQLLARAFLRVDITDTQAGLKLIRRDLLVRTLPVLEQNGFLLDIELLALARRLGYSKIVELPVRIRARVTSSVSPGSAASMGFMVLALWWKLRVTHHYDRRLERTKQRVASWETPFGHVDTSKVCSTVARPLRILIYNWRDLAHPHAGGAEVWTHEVASAWVRLGHGVMVFCSAVDGRPEVEDVDGVRYVRRGDSYSLYRSARKFYRRECRGRFDLVIDEVNTRPFGCASWVRDALVMSVVYQLAQEVWFYEMSLPVAFVGRLLLERRWLKKLQDLPIVTISESSKQSLEEIGLRGITVVPAGFDRARTKNSLAGLGQKETRPTLCWVGRLSANKRPDHALRAFEAARAQLPNAQMWMIGSGPMHHKLKRMASESVHFFGRVSDDEKHQLMGRAHALLATSVREGWGLTVTEAAAVGTATIGYAVPGLVDSVAASGGYLVPPSIEELGDEIVRRVPRLVSGEDGGEVHPGGVLDWDEVASGVLRASSVSDALANNVTACASAVRLERDDESASLMSRHRKVPPVAAFDESSSYRRLTLVRWSAAGAGLVALAGAAAMAPYAKVSEALANAALFALVSAALLLLVQSKRTNSQPSAWLPMRGTKAMWRGTSVAIALLSLVICQFWFSPGGAIAGGDVVPPVGTAWLRQLFAPVTWSGSNLGGPGANQLQFPWAAVLWVVHGAGGSAVLAQRLWMTALWVGAALAALMLLRMLGCGPGVATIGAAAYVLNPYVVSTTGTNPVYLAALALLPALPTVVLAVARRRLGLLAGASLFLISAPLVGYVYLNPPLVLLIFSAVVLSALIAAWLGGKESARRAFGLLGVGGVLLIVGAMYWIIPAVLQTHAAATGTLATTQSWAWTQGRSTTANAFWLNTTWGWAYKLYYPYAPLYSQFPLSLVRFLLPVAAFAALLLPSSGPGDRSGNRRLALIAPIALCALFLLALSTGTNPPGSIIFDPLYDLPYGWLLREPGRFLMGAGLAYAVLVALGVDAVARGTRASPLVDMLGSSKLRRGAASIAFAGIVALIPAYPLITGEIVPTSRGPFPSEHVNVPKYWQQMATAIDRAQGPGTVLMLPSDDFYQMPYTWGYYGADSFIENMMSRSVLDPTGQGYTPAANQLLSAVQLVSEYLLTHQWKEVTALLVALHTPYVLVRGDVDASFPQRHITSPARLATDLLSDPDIRLITRKGPLQLFALIGERSPRLATTRPISTPQEAPDLAILGLLPVNSSLITRPPQKGSPFVIQLASVGQWELRPQALVTTVKPPKAEVLSLGALDVRRPVLVSLTQSATVVPKLAITELPGGRYQFALPLGGSELRQTSTKDDGWGAIGDCNEVDPASADLAARSVSGAGPGDATEIELSARGDRACLQRPLDVTGGSVLVSMEARDASGLAPQICLWETPARLCASLPPLSGSSKWTHYQAVVSIPYGQMVRLFLYATPDGSGRRTTSEFADFAVRQLPEFPPTLDLVGTPLQLAKQSQLWVLDGEAGIGWRSTPAGQPVTVDGMLAGWVEPRSGGAPVVSYAPGRLIRAGQLLTVAAVTTGVVLVGLSFSLSVRRRRRRA